MSTITVPASVPSSVGQVFRHPIEDICLSHGLTVEFTPAGRHTPYDEFAILGEQWELRDRTAADCLRDFAARCLTAASELDTTAAEQAAAA